MSIELVMLSNHLILCHTLLFLLSIFPGIRVHSNESVLCIRWPKYWSFSISPSNEYSGLISFRIGWFDLLAIQGTLKSLLQHPSSLTRDQTKALALGVQGLSHQTTRLLLLFSRSVVSNSLRPHRPRFPVLHYLPEFTQTHVCWVGDTIQPSHPVIPFSSCPQSFPPSGSLQMSQLFTSASRSVLPMNTQDWSPLGWAVWISLQSKGLSRVFSNTHRSKASILQRSAFFIVQFSHPFMTTGKTLGT